MFIFANPKFRKFNYNYFVLFFFLHERKKNIHFALSISVSGKCLKRLVPVCLIDKAALDT